MSSKNRWHHYWTAPDTEITIVLLTRNNFLILINSNPSSSTNFLILIPEELDDSAEERSFEAGLAEAEDVPEEDGGYFPGDAEGDPELDLELAGDKPRKVRRSRTTFTTFQLHQLEVSSTQPFRSLHWPSRGLPPDCAMQSEMNEREQFFE